MHTHISLRFWFAYQAIQPSGNHLVIPLKKELILSGTNVYSIKRDVEILKIENKPQKLTKVSIYLLEPPVEGMVKAYFAATEIDFRR